LRHWLIMLVLGISGGIIFLLPYLKEIYYRPLADALGLSNTQVGVMMSAFGVTALISYFPGGWLADRYSPRALIALSMITTGLLGFYFATFPGFVEAVIVHAIWGVTITLLFWASMIRVTRGWAPPDEQGRAFGILETVRGVAELGLTTLLGAAFIWLGHTAAALSDVIFWLSGAVIALGVVCWFVIEDTVGKSEQDDAHKVGASEVLSVLKMPIVWVAHRTRIAGDKHRLQRVLLHRCLHVRRIPGFHGVRNDDCHRPHVAEAGSGVPGRPFRGQDRCCQGDQHLPRCTPREFAGIHRAAGHAWPAIPDAG
jgi:MFS family permease